MSWLTGVGWYPYWHACVQSAKEQVPIPTFSTSKMMDFQSCAAAAASNRILISLEAENERRASSYQVNDLEHLA